MRVSITLLDPTAHDRESFSCGKPRIDAYFREVSAQASRHFHAQTYVVTNVADPHPIRIVYGFYTLTPNEYRDDEMDPATARALKLKGLRSIPAILLGQLGVALEAQGRGIGPMLLDHAFRKVVFASYAIGGALLVTDPIDDAAAAFYKKYDFTDLPGCGTRLYLAMKTLAKAYPEVVAAAKASVT